MGWVFPASDTELAGAEPDPLNGAKSIRELYELASTNYTGKYTVPVCSLILSGLFMFYLSFPSAFVKPNDWPFRFGRFYGIKDSKQLSVTRVQRLFACSIPNSMI